MSGAGFNENEALRSRVHVLMDVEALGPRRVISNGCSVIVS